MFLLRDFALANGGEQMSEGFVAEDKPENHRTVTYLGEAAEER